jgi:hypothetical protein
MSDDIPLSPDSDTNSLASLPDSASSDDIDSQDERTADAEREWNESLQQLELLLTMVVVPYMGKYFGRKCAYWSTYSENLLNLSSTVLNTNMSQSGVGSWSGNIPSK